MKCAVIIAAVLAVALAAPQGPRQGGLTDDSQTQIVRFVNNNNAIDHYHFTYVNPLD